MTTVWVMLGVVIDGWARWMLAMSWQVTVLGLVILGLAVLARKGSANLRHALWCLILVKLCLPPTMSFVTGIGRWLPTPPARVQPVETAAELDEAPAAPLAFVPPRVSAIGAQSVAPFAPVTPSPPPFPWRAVLSVVWLAGASAVGGAAVVRYARLCRMLGDARAADEPDIVAALEWAKAQIGVRSNVRVLAVDGLPAPLVVGALRPHIGLPTGVLQQLPLAQLRPILLHELAHVRRGDLWLAWVIVAVQTAYWFHPIVWLAAWRLRRERELATDDMVLTHLGGGPELYGESLVSVLRGATSTAGTALSVGVIEAGGGMASRLRRILDVKRRLSTRLGWLSLAAIVGLALVFVPLARQTRAQEAEPQKTGASVLVAGEVLDAQGQPVEGAEVVAKYFGEGLRRATSTTTTGGDGSFEVTCPPSRHAAFISLTAHKPGRPLAWVRPHGRWGVTIRLSDEAPATCAGTVVDPAGKPIKGATVAVTRLEITPRESVELSDDLFAPSVESPLAAVTDEAGRFEVPDLPPAGKAVLLAVAEGREWVGTSAFVPTDCQTVRLVLPQAALLTGRVTREGEAMAGVAVEVYGRLNCSATTDADGRFTLDHLRAGERYAIIRAPEGLATQVLGPLDLRPGDRLDIGTAELTPGAVVSGRVTDAETGEPLDGVGLRVVDASRPKEAPSSGYMGTNRHGVYALRVPPGSYVVSCSLRALTESGPPGPWPETTSGERRVQLTEGGAAEGVNFKLPFPTRTPVVRGRVVTAEGQPVAGVWLGREYGAEYGDTEFGDGLMARSDAEGGFKLRIRRDPQNLGKWFILAMEPERGLAGLAVMPERQVPSEPVTIELTQGGYITFRAVSTDGRPLADVPLGMFVWPPGARGAGGMGPWVTDQEGRFRFGPLPVAASYTVYVSGRHRLLAEENAQQKTTVSPGGNVELPPAVINLAGRTLSGTVTDMDDRPVAGAFVDVSSAEDVLFTDSEGRFRATGLPARGKLWATAWHPKQPLYASVFIDPDLGEPANLVLRPTRGATGTVVNPTGKPVAGATVTCHRAFPAQEGLVGVMDGPGDLELQRRLGPNGSRQSTTTDAHGNWRVEGLLGGSEYVFQAKLPGGKAESRNCAMIVDPEIDFTTVGELRLRE
jgi:beta-lactamase regulating signal transducer with metallopeptidase domain